MNLSSGILFGLLVMFGFGMGNALSRIPAQKLGGLQTIFYRGVGVVLLQFIILIFFFPNGVTLRGVAIASVIAIFSYLPIMFFYKGLHLGKVGIISPIANSSAVITTLLAVIIFGEIVRPLQLAGGLFIVAGIILISLDFNDLKNSHLFKFSSGIPFAVAACIGWGIIFFLFKYPVTLIGPILTSFIVEFFVLVICMAHMRMKKEKFSLPKGYGKYLIPMSLFSVIGPLAYNYGIKTSAVSLVVLFYMANPLVAVAYARIFYKEKLSYQQYFAIFLIIFGVSGVSLLK